MRNSENYIPRRPVGSSGARSAQESISLVEAENDRQQSSTSRMRVTLEEPHSHYFDATGTSHIQQCAQNGNFVVLDCEFGAESALIHN